MTQVRLKPVALWSRVKHSTTEPLHSDVGVKPYIVIIVLVILLEHAL